MQKLIYILPHCSTGGMPAYVLRQIQEFKKSYDITVIEVNNYSDEYVVHRNKIKALVLFIQVFGNQSDLIKKVEELKPDILYFQEVPESFLKEETIDSLHQSCNNYWVTTHSSLTKSEHFKCIPDKIIAVNKWQQKQLESVCKTEVWEYPIDKKIIDYSIEICGITPEEDVKVLEVINPREKTGKDILNVGLFTPGKNQAELFEIARNNPQNRYHFVGNQAENFREYWEPLMKNKPDNCYVWGERNNLDVFYNFCDEMYFTSKFELNPIVVKEALSYGMPVKMRRLPTYGDDYDNNPLVTYINNPTVNIHYVKGCFVELIDWPEDSYNIQFINRKTGEVLYNTNIGNNSWAKCNYEYYVDWQIVISQSGEVVKIINQDLKDKNILISLDSKSLGDTLAWVPYAEEFRKKHNCNLYLSTYLNKYLDYSNIILVEPGSVVENIHAQYNIGWYYNGETVDKYRNPKEVKDQPLQKTASDILGIDFKEIRPKLKAVNKIYRYDQTGHRFKVAIATHSTLQAKYWNHPTGWDEVVDYIKRNCSSGVIHLSKEGENYMGNRAPYGVSIPENYDLETIIGYINACEFFIGVGSGLSWLAWALGKHVVLISGFSEPYTEFLSNVTRIGAPEGACSGCFNRVKLENKNGWNWCPDHFGSNRQFECSKLITPEMVIDKIKHLLK